VAVLCDSDLLDFLQLQHFDDEFLVDLVVFDDKDADGLVLLSSSVTLRSETSSDTIDIPGPDFLSDGPLIRIGNSRSRRAFAVPGVVTFAIYVIMGGCVAGWR
jgi:hypothetical protein